MKPLPLLIIALLTACSQSAPRAENSSILTTTQKTTLLPLVIRTAKGERRFNVEVARTAKEQERGLMFRRVLADNSGMLFPMDPPRTASFWMKNTLIPLDMLFIHPDGSIAFLKANALPYSRDPVSAGIPVAAVLELRGGRAAELGIGEGDRVRWGHCAAPADGRSEYQLNFCPAQISTRPGRTILPSASPSG